MADRIKQGPIPLDEALPIAKQIAEALEAAHEQGVIHRDLKPANVKVKDGGLWVALLRYSSLVASLLLLTSLRRRPIPGLFHSMDGPERAYGRILNNAAPCFR